MAIPTKPDAWDKVEQLLLQGYNLTEISKMAGMPSRRTMTERIHKDEVLSQRIARARDSGWDARAERAVEDARANPDAQRAKVVLDAEKWLLSKMSPERYGERMRNEISGPGGGPLVISDTERASRLASLINLAAQRKEDDTGDLA